MTAVELDREYDLARLAGGEELVEATGKSKAAVSTKMKHRDAPPACHLDRRRVWWYEDALAFLEGRKDEYLAAQGRDGWRAAPDVAGLSEVVKLAEFRPEWKDPKVHAATRLRQRHAPRGIELRSGRVWPEGGKAAVEFLQNPPGRWPQGQGAPEELAG